MYVSYSFCSYDILHLLDGLHGTGVQDEIALPYIQDAVCAALPKIIKGINEELALCDKESKTLEPARTTEAQKREYLKEVAADFTQALEGSVQDRPLNPGSSRVDKVDQLHNLRIALNQHYDEFVDDMVHHGQTSIIVADYEAGKNADSAHAQDQKVLTISQMLRKIEGMDKGQDKPAAGDTIDQAGLVAQLMVRETVNWEGIAQRHVERIHQTICDHMRMIIDTNMSKDTATKVQAQLLQEPMKAKMEQMKSKVTELVEPYRTWKPIIRSRDYWWLHSNKQWDNVALTQMYLPLCTFSTYQAGEQYAQVLNHFRAFYHVSF
jgi:hypothetical protein